MDLRSAVAGPRPRGSRGAASRWRGPGCRPPCVWRRRKNETARAPPQRCWVAGISEQDVAAQLGISNCIS